MRRLKEVGLDGARATRCRTSSPAGCASAPASPARSCSTRTSCSSTSPTPASTRSAPALLCELIEEIHAENGGTYVVITHDIMSAKRVADYIAVLWKGRIVDSGPADELFNSDNQFVRQFLAGRLAGTAGDGVSGQPAPPPPSRSSSPSRSSPGCCCSAAAPVTSTRSCSRTRASSCATTTSRSAAAAWARSPTSSSPTTTGRGHGEGRGAVRAAARGHARRRSG